MNDPLERWRQSFKAMVEEEHRKGNLVGIFHFPYWWWDDDVTWLQGPNENCPFQFLLFGCGDRVCGRRIVRRTS